MWGMAEDFDHLAAIMTWAQLRDTEGWKGGASEPEKVGGTPTVDCNASKKGEGAPGCGHCSGEGPDASLHQQEDPQCGWEGEAQRGCECRV